MKKLFSINVILLSFFLPVISNSFGDSYTRKEETKKIEVDLALTGYVRQSNDGAEDDSKTAATSWNADASKAQINFEVSGPFGKVHGSLSGLKSTILFDENNLASSSFRASVDPKSIRTGIGLRNRDLQKEKFLDSDNHPLISFHSEKIVKSGTGYKAIGSLTIKGVTKPVEIPFTFTEKAGSGLFKGAFTIHREDFGVGNKGGSVGKDVDITLEVPVTKSK
jgi:polyisoprenoid-binding protein YceI